MPSPTTSARCSARDLTVTRRHRRGRARAASERGALSLELALTVPALFLILMVLFHGLVLARDALIAQAAARDGARVAATTTDDRAVRRTVEVALDGRDATVSVTPRRGVGQIVRVEVTLRSRAGRGTTMVTGTATSVVEPGVRSAPRPPLPDPPR